MDHRVAMSLWLLAEDHMRAHAVPQAVLCLECICQSASPCPPAVEVKTRVRLARILLDHTDNLPEAKAHLERAWLIAKSSPGQWELKLQTLDLLARAHVAANHHTHAVNHVETGMAIALEQDLPAWYNRMALQCAELLLLTNNPTKAVAVCDTVVQRAVSAHDHVVVVVANLAKAQAYLHARDVRAAQGALKQCHSPLQKASKHTLTQLHIAHVCLHVITEAMQGRYALQALGHDLDQQLRVNKPDNANGLPEVAVDPLLSASGQALDGVSPAMSLVLAHAMAALAHLPCGALRASRRSVWYAHEAIVRARQSGLTACEQRLLPHLEVVLLHTQAIAYFVEGRYAQSAEVLQLSEKKLPEVQSEQARQALQASLHVTCAHICHSTRHHASALEHLSRASKLSGGADSNFADLVAMLHTLMRVHAMDQGETATHLTAATARVQSLKGHATPNLYNVALALLVRGVLSERLRGFSAAAEGRGLFADGALGVDTERGQQESLMVSMRDAFKRAGAVGCSVLQAQLLLTTACHFSQSHRAGDAFQTLQTGFNIAHGVGDVGLCVRFLRDVEALNSQPEEVASLLSNRPALESQRNLCLSQFEESEAGKWAKGWDCAQGE